MTTSKNDLVAGFDPGGKKSFGWCVAEVRPWRVIDYGVVSCAKAACGVAFDAVKNGNLVAAGVDAPLTWARDGGRRKSDEHIADWLRKNAQHSKGSVQAINSLRGACVVQGFLLAEALSRKYSKILFTETNPKPLRDCSNVKKSYEGVRDKDQSDEAWDHIQDAIVSAWAAAQARKAYDKDWKGQVGLNLYDDENEDQIYRFPFLNKKKTVYWWPDNHKNTVLRGSRSIHSSSG